MHKVVDLFVEDLNIKLDKMECARDRVIGIGMLRITIWWMHLVSVPSTGD